MVDHVLILRKLAELEKYLGQIREYSNISALDYANDWKTQRIVERTLQMMIELCVDIANHIISDAAYRIPNTYADTFEVLYENQLIGKAIYDKLVKMTKFRNIVIHQYDKIDEEIVVSILNKNLDDFLAYRDAIIEYLKATRRPE